MGDPLYRDLSRRDVIKRSAPANAHTGLWYSKFFNQYERERRPEGSKWRLTELPKEVDDAKTRWIKTVVGLRGDGPTLREQSERRRRLVKALGGRSQTFVNDWHFVTGLGLPHPVENGFAWHPTLGLPYLPAASVKGVVRAWVEVWSGWHDELKAERSMDWFGTPDQAGRWIFFEALPVAPVRLAKDVMTAHQGQWYAEGDQIIDPEKEPERVPADWHSPNPVPFLVVEQARFLFSIAPRELDRADTAEALEQVFEALTQALGTIGAGAKTAVGYGRWDPSTDEGKNSQPPFSGDLRR